MNVLVCIKTVFPFGIKSIVKNKGKNLSYRNERPRFKNSIEESLLEELKFEMLRSFYMVVKIDNLIVLIIHYKT